MTESTKRLVSAAKDFRTHMMDDNIKWWVGLDDAIKAVESETAEAQAQPAISEALEDALVDAVEEITPLSFDEESHLRNALHKAFRKHTGSTNAMEGAS